MPTKSVLDAESIARLVGLGGQHFLREILETYQLEAARRRQAMEIGNRDGDLTAVAGAAQALTSSAANIGAVRLSTVARQLEHVALAGDAGAVAHRLHELLAAYVEVSEAVALLLASSEG